MKLVTPEDDEDEEEAPSQTTPPQEDSPPKSQEDLNGKSEVKAESGKRYPLTEADD